MEGESLTLKNNIYKYMASISENVYVDKLHDIVNEYNNINNRAIWCKVKCIYWFWYRKYW